MSEDATVRRPRSRAESSVRLLLIGPMPPPVNGQSVVMTHLISKLTPEFPGMRISDSTASDTNKWLRSARKIHRFADSLRAVADAEVVYIAVKAGKGMWLTAAAAAAARRQGARVFLHHHSYAYVRERKRRMAALVRAAGPDAHHIVLSKSMSAQLCSVMPEISQPLVVGNAGLIDRKLLDLPLKTDGQDLVLGHVSDLTVEKGIGEVVDLAVALNRRGIRARLIVGGPHQGGKAGQHLNRADRELGDYFEYRGLLTGEAKLLFFREITHFIFPSRYVHEAVPLVLYEAMAAGVVCVATPQGSIPEQVESSPSFLARNADSFVDEAISVLSSAFVSHTVSNECRRAYEAALLESEGQLAVLSDLFAGR